MASDRDKGRGRCVAVFEIQLAETVDDEAHRPQGGGDTDTSRDYEYTDWNDVREFAKSFLRTTDSVNGSEVRA